MSSWLREFTPQDQSENLGGIHATVETLFRRSQVTLYPCLCDAVGLQPGACQDAGRPEDLAGRGPDDLDGARRVAPLPELPHLEAEVGSAAPRLELFAVFPCDLNHEMS